MKQKFVSLKFAIYIAINAEFIYEKSLNLINSQINILSPSHFCLQSEDHKCERERAKLQRLRRKSAKTQQRKGESAKTQYDYRSFTFALSFIIGIMQMQSMSYLTCLRLPNALECYWYTCASVAVPLSLLLTGLFDIFFNQ